MKGTPKLEKPVYVEAELGVDGPIAILKFNLEEPAQHAELQVMLQARHFQGVLFEMDQNLRSKLKWVDPKTDTERRMLDDIQELRDELHTALRKAGLSLDD